MAEKKKWCGPPPERCDICARFIKSAFVDGATNSGLPGFGRWANMCLVCHAKHGVGLGPGRGQQYELTAVDANGGEWVKVQG